GFYDAIQKPNANLITASIDRVEPQGIRTSDGALYPLDVLVLATGFRVEDFVRPMQVSGLGGTLLDTVWEGGPKAYLSICVPDFPNFFMLQGPSSPVGNFSLIEVAELQVEYILSLIRSLGTGSPQAISVSKDAAARYELDRQKAAEKTVWASGCNSWYIGKDGLPIAWPFTFDRFREEMKAPRLQDFETQ
ncbi:NAD(P)/FAD-dependent oxidoreductase, partial [Myxococcota bacterium]|nr:NAD(P)/FAD-dependent oxidoreductase [Myxococcota bacterium]